MKQRAMIFRLNSFVSEERIDYLADTVPGILISEPGPSPTGALSIRDLIDDKEVVLFWFNSRDVSDNSDRKQVEKHLRSCISPDEISENIGWASAETIFALMAFLMSQKR